MASRAANFRGTKRTLYNPASIKFLEHDEARKEYRTLRRTAMKRQKRLAQKGLEPSLAQMDFPASSMLDDEQIKEALLDVSRFLKNPFTFVSVAKEVPGAGEERITVKKGRAKGTTYDRHVPDQGSIIGKNRQAFGDFMDNARARMKGRLFDSNRTQAAYEDAVKRGMRPRTLEKHFSDYLKDQEKLKDLAETLEAAPTDKRLTIDMLKELLG